MRLPKLTVSIALASLFLARGASDTVTACTTFCLRDADHVLFGRNYDFGIGEGLVLVNKRGVAKTSAVSGDVPASWTSRHGSLTFNQFGREFPTGGINEKGLTVELMMLDGSQYPARDSRPAVGVLEWIQYQLDNRASVAELIAHADEIRIHGGAPLHYLVADRTGAAATVEFLAGRLVIHTAASLEVPVLTNDTYESSIGFMKTHPGATGSSSLARFARAAALIGEYGAARPAPPVEYAFRVLDEVSQGGATRWSIVYDLTDMVVRFRTASHRPVRSIRLKAFDYSCATPVRMLDLDAPLEGDVTAAFSEYTSKANLDLVVSSYARVPFLAAVPEEQVRQAAHHPETTRCLP
ncbi:MAG TPA: linear amide C-N hydrolase [Patescibacteria group bacterium]|nr:linear amide C-N hydrolase [Patescibacteria group bacterium]